MTSTSSDGLGSNPREIESDTKSCTSSDQPNDPVAETIAPTTPSSPEHVSKSRLIATMGALSLVVLLFALDSTIVATATPKITDEFKTVADIGWYGASYLLVNASLQPMAGKVYTYLPMTTSFITFLSVYEIGSIVCAVATSSAMLIIGRAVSAIGSSGLMNGSITILGLVAPAHKRPMLLGLLMSVMGVGQVGGPLIGGVLADKASWRWCFWINLPVGACAGVALIMLRVRNENRRRDLTVPTFFKKFDILGFLLFAPACIMLLLALEWGGVEHAWNSATVIGLFCGSGVMFCIFIGWEWYHGENAMFPGTLLGRRLVWSSCVTAAFTGGALFVLTYYLPIWFQAILRRTPIMSAVDTLPFFGFQIVGAVISGWLVSRVGYFTPFAIVGAALVILGASLMSTFNPTTTAGQWIGYQVLVGLGRGTVMQQPMAAVQASLTGAEMSTGMAIISWAQFMGGAVVIALGQTMFSNTLRTAMRALTPDISPRAVINAGATDYLRLAAPAQQHNLLLAYNRAITHTYYLSLAAAAIALFASFGMGWKKVLSKQVQKQKSEPATEQVQTIETKA